MMGDWLKGFTEARVKYKILIKLLNNLITQ